MDLISTVLSAILFYAFVPGVVGYFPKGASRMHVLITHAVLFALVTSAVMNYYWTHVKQYIENMGNYGTACPNGYVMTPDQSCVAVGHATYSPTKSPVPTK